MDERIGRRGHLQNRLERDPIEAHIHGDGKIIVGKDCKGASQERCKDKGLEGTFFIVMEMVVPGSCQDKGHAAEEIHHLADKG